MALKTAMMVPTICNPVLRHRLMGKMLCLTTIDVKTGLMAVDWVDTMITYVGGS